ncbi:hypothetical protein PPL_04953 [Heterostelium album PN500]|uniref:B box-type domain-containing protein n=1 Tax=Heterostelium pallidum (strain ATCC 26659 / Pp 5 / PN500) TaxID=670386 RepID=D3B909_HETP5|nr:hypothetical protein PPL_04953 [Heterostelium album PN500]EFA82048.1 hypothetical protein PPL_04953 [Heterostelium album PN500]|eukprot:XP_020434165.1 hypothetical protein PPL_04953 [Heterostelium album PN500]
MTIKCLNHQRSHEFICYQCNSLMCSKCITIHIKDHPDHSDKIEHIDEIKDSLSTLKLDDIIDTTTTTNNNDSTNSIPRHNMVVKVILKEMLKFHRIPYKPGAVYQSDTIEILHEARIDNALTKTNKPDLIVKNRTKKSIKIIEISVPYDNNIVKRSRDKIEKYQPLAAALKKSNPDHKVAVIPIIIGAFENDIKQHFEQLHQYLIIEEHKLQRDIINDKHTITNQIDKNIMNLKYLINIIILFNKLNNNNNSSDNNSNGIINNEDTSIIPDTTTLYSTTTIMESITTSSSLQSFINHNNQTLFNDKNNNYFNIDELIKQHSSDSSSILLDIIHKYNNQFNESTTNTDDNNLTLSSYKLTIKQPDFNQLNSIIEQSIKLDNIESTESINTTTTTNNNDNKQSYIFTTHQSKGATLINTSNNNSIEELKFDYQFDFIYSAIVSIGEYIYIFGGYTNENKWIKISIRSKSIEHIGDIEGIKGDYFISVCYDGQDHIYLVNGWKIKNRIDRFNIKTMKFESYHQIPFGYDRQVSSMIFKGSLYSISYNQYKLFQFDLTNRTIIDHQIDIIPFSACHDNNGNFFILDRLNKRFIKYNVETKQTINLNAVPLANAYYPFVMYHRESPTSSYIYSFGYSNRGVLPHQLHFNK